MAGSFTATESQSFTVTHAQKIAAKVATDLYRLHAFYGSPTMEEIQQYETEIIAMLSKGYIKTVTYGFRRNGNWVIALRYEADESGNLVLDNDPGSIRPSKEGIKGLKCGSYMTYSPKWWQLSSDERDTFKKGLPFYRGNGDEPGIENGYWATDNTYSAGGKSLKRSTLKRYT